MLNSLLMLLSLSTLMAIASFLAGLLPLSFALSQSQLRVISTLGTGVLVGTSLSVIIPEGIDTLYTANSGALEAHIRRGIETDAGTLLATTAADPRALQRRKDDSGVGTAADGMLGPVLPTGVLHDLNSPPADVPKGSKKPGEVHILDTPDVPDGSAKPNEPPKSEVSSGRPDAIGTDAPAHAPAEASENRTSHAWVGISIILGFILMYLIDELPSLAPPPSTSRANIYSLSDLSNAPATPTSHGPNHTFSTTLGLVIHAAADGIALGASSTQPSLSFIVFFAIMIHKAPAAFGLTTVLLKQGLGKRQARAHLMAFSLAAPVGAILTWILVHILGGAAGDELSSEAISTRWWTGVILLFSGGTFLYVAMHTMQESREDALNAEDGHSNGYADYSHSRDSSRHTPRKSPHLVAVAVVGMLLPLVTQIWHAH